MNRKHEPKALTLVELLVVIVVVVILASLFIPCTGPNVMEKAKQTKALNNAKQISLALKQYAVDFDGAYPRYLDPKNKTGDPKNSNEILKTLIPDYIGDEKVFAVHGSAWTTPGPDGMITPDSEKLKAGENGWFYITGLTDRDNARWPLMASAPSPSSESDPRFSYDEKAKGGVWKGAKIIVLRVDGSAKVEASVDSKGKGDLHVPRDDDPTKNALKYDPTAKPPWLKPPPDALYLNPL